jgi:hypothetical protein
MGTSDMNKSIILSLYRLSPSFSAWDGIAVLSAVRVRRQNPLVNQDRDIWYKRKVHHHRIRSIPPALHQP